MFPLRARRPFDWECLEVRHCPAPFVGPLPNNSISTVPAERTDPGIVDLMKLDASAAAAWTSPLVFYGDSILYNFGYAAGAPVWGRSIAPLDAEDFSVPGDMTQNVLWRIEDGGELVGHPKVAVVQVGINNLISGRESPAETYAGIEAVVAAIHAKSPSTKILLIGLLPYGGPTNPLRTQIVSINAALAASVDGRSTYFLNVGPQMMDADQAIGANFLPDLGHPNVEGYHLWANAMAGELNQLLGITPAPSPKPPPFIGPLPQKG
jgi:lysophospholipase L1-like esterase